jgi:hypothetical protein
MNADELSESTSSTEEGSVAQRPGCVTAYALLFFLAAALGLLSPFLIRFGPAGSELSQQDLTFGSIRSIAQAVILLLLAVGLWRLRRWAVALVVAWVLYTFGNSLYASIATGNSNVSSAWYPIVSGLFALAVVYWFVKNQQLFEPSPSLDRWIVIAGTLVLVALFAMNVVWM